jgi:acyl-[acyl-carrier-protein] desaturase
MTTQHLLVMVSTLERRDPYKTLYTRVFRSFLLCFHRVAQMAKKYGDNKLSKMCKMIAETRCVIIMLILSL